jgi:hypothetical protein
MPDEIHIPKLLEGNYEQWRCFMEATLIASDLWDVTSPLDPKSPPKNAKEAQIRKRKEQQARAKIVLALDPSQLPFISGLEDPRKIWEALESIHRSMSVNSVLSLRRQFFRLTKTDSETTMLWISRVRNQALELKDTPAPISDLDVILVITNGLPPAFETVISALDALPFSELNIPTVIQRIMGHEAHINRFKDIDSADTPSISSSEAPAAQANLRRRKRGVTWQNVICYNCGGRGHVKSDCPSEPIGQTASYNPPEDNYAF